MDALFSVADAARRLRVHEDTVRRRIRDGSLPVVWVGRCIRIRAEDVERLIQDPRLIECGVCEVRFPWNAATCPRCGSTSPRTDGGR